LFYKICGYFNEVVHVQLIRSPTRRCVWGQQHCPSWQYVYPKK